MLRDSVIGYLISDSDQDKLLYFNKLVSVCTSNTTKLFIPSRTKGLGMKGEKVCKDNLVKDLAEEFVADFFFEWSAHTLQDTKKACELGEFDFLPRRFKQRVLNRIRDIKRSREEDWVEMLPEEEVEDSYDDGE